MVGGGVMGVRAASVRWWCVVAQPSGPGETHGEEWGCALALAGERHELLTVGMIRSLC